MIRYAALATILTLTGCAVDGEKSETYTFGDLVSGEEVQATVATLDEEIAKRVLKAEPTIQTSFAYVAQVSNDGILCDMLVTRMLLQENPGLNISDVAWDAQILCLGIGNGPSNST